jgi:hypothetical protein
MLSDIIKITILISTSSLRLLQRLLLHKKLLHLVAGHHWWRVIALRILGSSLLHLLNAGYFLKGVHLPSAKVPITEVVEVVETENSVVIYHSLG